jgi:hypothetical protein
LFGQTDVVTKKQPTAAADDHEPGASGERTQLSTFKFSKHPSEMTEEELGEMADRILDQWAKDLDDLSPLPS